jgi:hypothetical protein
VLVTDARLRELERIYRATGAASDEGAWLAEQVRAGQLEVGALELRAARGEAGARLACEVLGPRLLVLFFTADWSGPDRIVRPQVDRALARLADIAVQRRVNVDEEPDLAVHFAVRAVPTLLAFSAGRPLGESVGVQAQLDAWLDERVAQALVRDA